MEARVLNFKLLRELLIRYNDIKNSYHRIVFETISSLGRVDCIPSWLYSFYKFPEELIYDFIKHNHFDKAVSRLMTLIEDETLKAMQLKPSSLPYGAIGKYC